MNPEVRMERSGPIAVATLNRPHRRNALTLEMFDDFVEIQREVEADRSIRALVLTGEGAGFCAGLDLDVAAQLPAMSADHMLRGQEHWARAVTGFATMDTPVIAAVNGAAAGAGFGLALAADIRLADESTRFNAAFVKIGLSGGDVGTSWTLPRIVGGGRAAEILMTGRFVNADEALSIGLVSDVVAVGAVLDRALEVAESVCAISPFAVTMTKQVLRTNSAAPTIEVAVAVENRTQVLATRTADMAEALAAFREGRTPVYGGR